MTTSFLVIYDPKTNQPSVAVAHHIADVSAEDPNLTFYDAFSPVKSSYGSTGALNVVPDLEIEPCGGFGLSPAISVIKIGEFDTLFEIPFFLNDIGSFDVCFGACRPSECDSYPGQKCPGTYGIVARFMNRGRDIINQETSYGDFFSIRNGIGGWMTDPLVNGENTYNRVICGGALELS